MCEDCILELQVVEDLKDLKLCVHNLYRDVYVHFQNLRQEQEQLRTAGLREIARFLSIELKKNDLQPASELDSFNDSEIRVLLADLLRGDVSAALRRGRALMATRNEELSTVSVALAEAAVLYLSEHDYSLENLFASFDKPVNPKVLAYLSTLC